MEKCVYLQNKGFSFSCYKENIVKQLEVAPDTNLGNEA